MFLRKIKHFYFPSKVYKAWSAVILQEDMIEPSSTNILINLPVKNGIYAAMKDFVFWPIYISSEAKNPINYGFCTKRL